MCIKTKPCIEIQHSDKWDSSADLKAKPRTLCACPTVVWISQQQQQRAYEQQQQQRFSLAAPSLGVSRCCTLWVEAGEGPRGSGWIGTESIEAAQLHTTSECWNRFEVQRPCAYQSHSYSDRNNWSGCLGRLSSVSLTRSSHHYISHTVSLTQSLFDSVSTNLAFLSHFLSNFGGLHTAISLRSHCDVLRGYHSVEL